MIYVVISPKVRIGCDRVRQKVVARRWLLVARKKSSRYRVLVGFEANPNASGGRRVSEANDSEGGRFRRTSETRGEKESHSLRHALYIVFRMSYIARKETKGKERGSRSQPECFQWKKSEFYERQ